MEHGISLKGKQVNATLPGPGLALFAGLFRWDRLSPAEYHPPSDLQACALPDKQMIPGIAQPGE